MKSFNKNLHIEKIIFSIVIVVFCVGAFYFWAKKDTMPVGADKDETYRKFIANNLEEMLTSSNAILSSNVDFEVENNAVTKVYLTLECAETLSSETEYNIKSRVADAMNMSINDISISY